MLFIEALTGAADAPVTIQTFDDSPARRGGLARILHGPLTRHAAHLDALNRIGAGIFMMVNAGDLRGRTSANVVELRALFIDADGPLNRPYQLPPSILVRSARGEHAYWLVGAGADLLGRFTASQKHLASFYGTDPAVCDLARVMRLPGFRHLKAAPFDVELLHADGSCRYALAEVIDAHPLPGSCRPPRPRARPAVVGRGEADAERFTAWAARRPIREGSRNTTAFSIAAEGFRRGFSDAFVGAVVHDYCERASIAEEARAVIRSAARYHQRRS